MKLFDPYFCFYLLSWIFIKLTRIYSIEIDYLNHYLTDIFAVPAMTHLGSYMISKMKYDNQIYIYPTSSKAPNGKLRLLYECNPMAFIAEQAGGRAIDGFQRIMEIQPTELHQRVPFFCGSSNMVSKAEEFMKASDL